jgi:hypothetical protein
MCLGISTQCANGVWKRSGLLSSRARLRFAGQTHSATATPVRQNVSGERQSVTNLLVSLEGFSVGFSVGIVTKSPPAGHWHIGGKCPGLLGSVKPDHCPAKDLE